MAAWPGRTSQMKNLSTDVPARYYASYVWRRLTLFPFITAFSTAFFASLIVANLLICQRIMYFGEASANSRGGIRSALRHELMAATPAANGLLHQLIDFAVAMMTGTLHHRRRQHHGAPTPATR